MTQEEFAKLKVGDKVEILKDDLALANVSKGDILTIEDRDDEFICTTGHWTFGPEEAIDLKEVK